MQHLGAIIAGLRQTAIFFYFIIWKHFGPGFEKLSWLMLRHSLRSYGVVRICTIYQSWYIQGSTKTTAAWVRSVLQRNGFLLSREDVGGKIITNFMTVNDNFSNNTTCSHFSTSIYLLSEAQLGIFQWIFHVHILVIVIMSMSPPCQLIRNISSSNQTLSPAVFATTCTFFITRIRCYSMTWSRQYRHISLMAQIPLQRSIPYHNVRKTCKIDVK